MKRLADRHILLLEMNEALRCRSSARTTRITAVVQHSALDVPASTGPPGIKRSISGGLTARGHFS